VLHEQSRDMYAQRARKELAQAPRAAGIARAECWIASFMNKNQVKSFDASHMSGS